MAEFQNVLDHLGEFGDKELIALAKAGMGNIYWRQGNSIKAIEYLDSALSLSQAIGKVKLIAMVHNLLGSVYLNQDMNEQALQHYQISLAIGEKSGDKLGTANCYNNIGLIYKGKGEYDKALDYYKQALKWHTEIGDKSSMANGFNNMGIIYDLQSKFSEALAQYNEALKLRKEVGDVIGVAYAYGNIGGLHDKFGYYQEALKYYMMAMTSFKEMGANLDLASAYNNIGSIYYSLGDYPKAYTYYYDALHILEPVGNKRGMAHAYIGLANIQMKEGKLDESFKNAESGLKLWQDIKDKRQIASAYSHIGSIYFLQEQYIEALEYYKKSLMLREEMNDSWGTSISNTQIGNVYQIQENYPEASKYLLKALEIQRKIGNQAGIAQTCLSLGMLRIRMNEPENAGSYLKEAKELAQELDIKSILMNSFLYQSVLDSLVGNYEGAFKNYKWYRMYSDSILNVENNRMITEIQTKYDAERKDKEIQRMSDEKRITDLELKLRNQFIDRMSVENKLKANEIDLLHKSDEVNHLKLVQNEAEMDAKNKEVALLNNQAELHKLTIRKQAQTRNYLLGGIGLFLLLSFFVYNNYLTRQQLKLQKLRNKIAMDLHDDVGSTLSSISIFSEMAREQSKEVVPLLDTIGENSRKMLDAMADIVWTINPENDQFEKIILRMRNFAYQLLGTQDINFEFDVDDDVSQIRLPMEVRKNFYLIFKEATNNMVKYAQADRAHFSISEKNKMLTLLVQDNGKGFDVNEASKGNGLKNMKKRAEEIGGRLRIESKRDQGTVVTLSLAV